MRLFEVTAENEYGERRTVTVRSRNERTAADAVGLHTGFSENEHWMLVDVTPRTPKHEKDFDFSFRAGGSGLTDEGAYRRGRR